MVVRDRSCRDRMRVSDRSRCDSADDWSRDKSRSRLDKNWRWSPTPTTKPHTETETGEPETNSKGRAPTAPAPATPPSTAPSSAATVASPATATMSARLSGYGTDTQGESDEQCEQVAFHKLLKISLLTHFRKRARLDRSLLVASWTVSSFRNQLATFNLQPASKVWLNVLALRSIVPRPDEGVR